MIGPCLRHGHALRHVRHVHAQDFDRGFPLAGAQLGRRRRRAGAGIWRRCRPHCRRGAVAVRSGGAIAALVLAAARRSACSDRACRPQIVSHDLASSHKTAPPKPAASAAHPVQPAAAILSPGNRPCGGRSSCRRSAPACGPPLTLRVTRAFIVVGRIGARSRSVSTCPAGWGSGRCRRCRSCRQRRSAW